MTIKYLILRIVSYISLLMSVLPSMPQVRLFSFVTGPNVLVLDFIGLANSYGYEVESHSVTTEDGYILTVFKLSRNKCFNRTSRARVIFLQHALISSPDIFILRGPTKSLAFQLSDAGYDVWLGNFRGNSYSRRHETLSPLVPEFWDFCLDDYALTDLPAIINYVMEVTGESRIPYIGYSIGTTAMSMLLSEKPEYNSKLYPIIFLAPVAHWEVNNFLRYIMKSLLLLTPLLAPETEALYQNNFLPWLFKNFFSKTAITSRIFKIIPHIIFGKNDGNINHEILYTFLPHFPAGTSTKALFQLAQHAKTGRLERYDYDNPQLNQEHYGQDEPLEYNVTRITGKIALLRGSNDPFTPDENVKKFIELLPTDSLLLDYVVPDDKFTHADFVISKNVRELINDKVVTILEEFS